MLVPLFGCECFCGSKLCLKVFGRKYVTKYQVTCPRCERAGPADIYKEPAIRGWLDGNTRHKGNTIDLSLCPPGVVEQFRTKHVWLVWSACKSAWWRGGRSGYTNHVESAGRYSLEDALDCCGFRDDGRGGPGEIVHLAPEALFQIDLNKVDASQPEQLTKSIL